MPAPEIVCRYAELGGRAVALGSDAHSAACVGSHFDVALEITRQAGITRQAVFENRRMRLEPLG